MDYEIEQGTGRLLALGTQLPSYIHMDTLSVDTPQTYVHEDQLSLGENDMTSLMWE